MVRAIQRAIDQPEWTGRYRVLHHEARGLKLFQVRGRRPLENG
jgi:hypothetical protein